MERRCNRGGAAAPIVPGGGESLDAKGISEIVGQAESVGKSRVTVYRALRMLICAMKCGR